MLCIKLHPPNIENAPPLNRSCTPSEPKLHPLNGFLSKLESFATSEQALYRLLRLFTYKSQNALRPLFLLSKSHPLRWAAICLGNTVRWWHLSYFDVTWK